ncbi:hypothetical protein [Croceicoccus naphthovorans]|uniref:Uncharacterized protein n=1 Tax=Croceicoccus naphthovorans TaxID=1348774 RepID=A0A0G3XH42_9SPHN|nr:hypothetical protein [Croceicoccus naphthovorans]AKM10517.1 hypothetical protein AB433_11975 [Croceicoccus naphthovorans]MBB3988708.1 hypothetical protein [Croceicoccus naphthovorans]
MVTRIVGADLDLLTLNGQDQPRHVADFALENCEVMGNMLASVHPGEWRTIRNCSAVKCMQMNCSLAGTVVEDCLLDTMGQKGRSYLQLDACVFIRTTVRGRITTTLFRFDPHPFQDTTTGPKFSDQWRDELAARYRGVDWALDITEAKFASLTSLVTVPGHLVHFAPERAIRIRREGLTDGWQERMPMIMQICCEDFIFDSPFDSFVVARGEKKADREKFAEWAAIMRAEDFADPA